MVVLITKGPAYNSYHEQYYREILMTAINTPKSTKRVGIKHLHQLSDTALESISNALKAGHHLACSIKVDGLGFRFGTDLAGRRYVESSTSGIVYDPAVFYTYTAAKTSDPVRLNRALAYTKFANSLLLESSLFSCLKPGHKIVVEILATEIGTLDGNGNIKFVNSWYAVDQLGSLITVIPLHCLDETGTKLDQAETLAIVEQMKSLSSDSIKVINNKEFCLSIDADLVSVGSVKDLIYKAVNDKCEETQHLGTNLHEGVVVTIDGIKFKVIPSLT